LKSRTACFEPHHHASDTRPTPGTFQNTVPACRETGFQARGPHPGYCPLM
jgi:hypothetical protein